MHAVHQNTAFFEYQLRLQFNSEASIVILRFLRKFVDFANSLDISEISAYVVLTLFLRKAPSDSLIVKIEQIALQPWSLTTDSLPLTGLWERSPETRPLTRLYKNSVKHG